MTEPTRSASSAADAAALLNAASQGDQAGSRLSRSALRPLRIYSFALALLVGLFFLAIVYFLSDADPVVVRVATGIYLVLVAAVVIGYLRARRATALRADRRLLIGTAATTVLFVPGTLLSTVVDTRSPFLWIACSVVMMLPLALSTFVRTSR